MLQQNPARCYAIKTVHPLWTVCLQTCNICEEQSCSEWSAGALVLCFCFQFLNRDPAQRLAAAQTIRSHPFFKAMDWEELEKKHVRPPIHPKPVKRSKVHGPKKIVLITPALPVFNAGKELFRGFSA